MSEDYLDRRARMFERSPTQTGTAASGRPSPQIGRRVNPAERIRDSPSGRGMGLLALGIDAAERFIEVQRSKAMKGVRDTIQEQLQLGEEIRVFVRNLDPLEGTFDDVSVGDPKPDAFVRENTNYIDVCGGGPCGPQSGRLPERKDFTVPTTRGPQTVRLGGSQPAAKPAKPPEPKKRSPAEARPGRGEFKDWVDRWNRDPGLIDRDFDHADRIGRTA